MRLRDELTLARLRRMPVTSCSANFVDQALTNSAIKTAPIRHYNGRKYNCNWLIGKYSVVQYTEKSPLEPEAIVDNGELIIQHDAFSGQLIFHCPNLQRPSCRPVTLGSKGIVSMPHASGYIFLIASSEELLQLALLCQDRQSGALRGILQVIACGLKKPYLTNVSPLSLIPKNQ